MKNLWAVLLVTLTLFFSCGKKSPTKPTEDFSRYFPLEVNYKWYFSQFSTPDAKLIYSIWEAREIDGKLYYAYGNTIETSGFFRKDARGNVYKWLPTGEVLWFNFYIADGGMYDVKLSDIFIYEVTVKNKKNITILLNGQTYVDCISFSFRALTTTYKGINYSIAPDIGIVSIGSDSATISLDSFEFPQ